jgi:hypothetical protein
LLIAPASSVAPAPRRSAVTCALGQAVRGGTPRTVGLVQLGAVRS